MTPSKRSTTEESGEEILFRGGNQIKKGFKYTKGFETRETKTETSKSTREKVCVRVCV